MDSNNDMVRITISLPQDVKRQLEDKARENRRNKQPMGSVSALIRAALEDYKF